MSSATNAGPDNHWESRAFRWELDHEGRWRERGQLDGLTGTVAVEPADDKALRATVRFPKLSALPAIIARLRRVFDLGADPLAIAAHLAKDPTLAPLVKARPGLRVPGGNFAVSSAGFEPAISGLKDRRPLRRHHEDMGERVPGGSRTRLTAVGGRCPNR